VEPKFGFFQKRRRTVRLVGSRGKEGRLARAVLWEEKGTDVSLGAHLLWDAFHKNMDRALVLSNDADLQVPVTMTMELGLPVVVVNPHRHSPQRDCLFGSETRKLTKRHLAASQLPREVSDASGRVIRCPPEWEC